MLSIVNYIQNSIDRLTVQYKSIYSMLLGYNKHLVLLTRNITYMFKDLGHSISVFNNTFFLSLIRYAKKYIGYKLVFYLSNYKKVPISQFIFFTYYKNK